MKSTVVIITDRTDITVDPVITALEKSGEKVVRFNFSDSAMGMKHDVKMNGRLEGEIVLQDNGRTIDLKDVKSIWWRKPEIITMPSTLTKQEKIFSAQEMHSFLYGVFQCIDPYWLSNPDAIESASRKLEQLQRATRFGFTVPDTLITTNYQSLESFYAKHSGEVIYKVMSDPFLGFSFAREKHVEEAKQWPKIEEAPLITKTTLIDQEKLDLFDREHLVPCLFQRRIHKKYELRITIVEDEVFSAAIFSQENEKTALDWRDYSIDTRYEKFVLPKQVEEACIEYVRSYGLNYSALDFVVTPEGEYVFLENNPNGQFMFIQQFVPELKITESITHKLIRGIDPGTGRDTRNSLALGTNL